MTELIDGRAIASQIRAQLERAVQQVKGQKPGLAVILVGEHPASKSYVQAKRRAAQTIGIRSLVKELPTETSQEELTQQILQFNEDPTIDGILLQLPLPNHLNASQALYQIDPTKDVDGFHPVNLGKLMGGDESGFIPCTPLGIYEMLVRSHVNVEGRRVVILGRSNIVGKPLAALLMQKRATCNATVTVAHSRTRNLPEVCREAEILISAIGRPRFVTKEWVREGAVVIDVGINRVDAPQTAKGYELVGDVDFEAVMPKSSLITPVPGGVGPMTVSMLMENTWTSFCRRSKPA
jgi:methylenetetrahydrofolate dehydrogenase (NADP+) / methenyltetrahydrofolate cyclohydrolase